jgi:hypothetical protein
MTGTPKVSASAQIRVSSVTPPHHSRPATARDRLTCRMEKAQRARIQLAAAGIANAGNGLLQEINRPHEYIFFCW